MSCRSSPTTLAAASSIASGSPSTRRQISPTSSTCPIAVERSLGTGAGSLLEQADRVGLRQRCEPVVHLVDDPQRLAARREDVEPREAGGEILDEIGHRRHDVLAVVEHQQDIAIGQPAGERFLVRLTARPLHPDLCGHLAGDEIR